MNNEQLVLLKIISKSQFGYSAQIEFDTIDMDALFSEALNQSVLGLIAAEIVNFCSDSKWIEAQFRQKSSYILYCHYQNDLKDLLNSNNIPFVILKGNASAIYYKDPSKRSMGDIDFLVPQEFFDKAKQLLIDHGYVEGYDSGRHIDYYKDNFIFELHHHFSHDVDIEGYLEKGLLTHEIGNIDGIVFPILPDLANGLVLLDHFRRHLKKSIGLRQVIDWMMYVYQILNDDFWNNEFKFVAEEKGMATFAITSTRMCQIYLGLSENITWCKSADENVCEQLMECILSSGNFGCKNGIGKSVESVSTGIRKVGLFTWLQNSGETNWRAYQKHHWLKPLCWFYQIFRYSKQVILSGRSRKQLRDDIKRSKERFELLKKLGIE